MKTRIFALLSGLLFGLGLLLSGLADPSKVLAFLDLAGNWDPSLAFVMGGAITVAYLPFARAKRIPLTLGVQPLAIQLPTSRTIDRPLVLGAALFGIGWGLLGVCPGPALVLLGSGSTQALIFVAAMLLGASAHKYLSGKR